MKRFFSFADVIVVCTVLAVSAAGYAYSAFAAAGNEKYVIIEVEGKTFAEYAMSSLKTPVIVDVYGKNKVEITNDYARVIYADCPDRLDVRQGKITKAGSVIVCMPNKMTVRIEGKSEVDAISR